LNRWAGLDNIEFYTLRELQELKDSYLESLTFDDESKGYRDPKYPNVILKFK